MPIGITLDVGMIARDRDVVNNTHITVLTTSDSYATLVRVVNELLRVDYVKDFLVIALEGLQDYEVVVRFLNADDVNDLVLVGNLEG